MSYKIALTSSGEEKIDLHFGHTKVFRIFEVEETSGAWRFLEERALATAVEAAPEKASPPPPRGETTGCSTQSEGCGTANGSGCGHNHDRLAALCGLLADCAYVLTAKIGPRPHDALKRAGITALESPPELSAAIPKLNAYHLKYANNNNQE